MMLWVILGIGIGLAVMMLFDLFIDLGKWFWGYIE